MEKFELLWKSTSLGFGRVEWDSTGTCSFRHLSIAAEEYKGYCYKFLIVGLSQILAEVVVWVLSHSFTSVSMSEFNLESLLCFIHII
ncbi:hypothetical protein SDJN02_22390, partial [Cucurbita argyrosperma subsp. argyrosperma]